MGELRVGCVGLGTMGGPMAANLVRAGFPTSVFDVRDGATDPYREQGAHAPGTLSEVAAVADVLTITVLNDGQLDAVVLGDGDAPGALAVMRPGSVILTHSTVTPGLCRRIAERAAELGVGFVDAPISGGEQAAIDGTLTLMVGGAATHVQVCGPVFAVVGAEVYHLGGPGAGQLGKLVNNLMGIATRVVVREGLDLARAAGLDEDVTLDFVRHSSGNSWQVENWRAMQQVGGRAIGGPAGMAKIAQKDLDMALSVAADFGVELPLTAEAAQRIDGMFGAFG